MCNGRLIGCKLRLRVRSRRVILPHTPARRPHVRPRVPSIGYRDDRSVTTSRYRSNQTRGLRKMLVRLRTGVAIVVTASDRVYHAHR